MDLKVGENKSERAEVFNFKNKACQEAFFEETNVNQDLVECFKDNEQSLGFQAEKWRKSFKNILHKCFRKIRITKRKEQFKSDIKLKERIKLKNEEKSSTIDEDMREQISKRISQIEEDIGDDVAKENHKIIIETIKELGDEDNLNGSGRKKLWGLLKEKFPKNSGAE